jgi:hypothetical protein
MSSFTKSIERWPITSALFIDKSIPFTPRMISLIANGFFYKRAEIEKYVSDIFVPCKLQDVEIITGYYTMSDANSPRTHGQCIYISSNFPQERSAIKDFTPIVECVKVDFASKSISDMTDEEMDQLMKRTIRTIQYTTNIPIISQPLDDGSALDFGVIAPNPSTVVKAQLDKCIYFSPVDIEGY